MTRPHPLTFTRHALRELDRRAVHDFHVPILVLMENAGRALADAARGHLRKDAAALIVCGPGNNGGDGLVAARHLHNAGVPVKVMLLTAPADLRDAAAAQLAIVNAMGIPVAAISADHAEIRDWVVEGNPHDIVIDALFGTGLTREVAGLPWGVIHALNLANRTTIAADIPSGLDCDTGEPLGIALRAAETVSFCGLKPAFHTKTGAAYAGKVTIADIGAPAALLNELGELKQ